jgi:tetratricopeptide (TPR) repeat protein
LALAGFDTAVDLNPRLADGYYNRRVAYAELGDNEKAKAVFLEILRLSYDPDLRAQFEEQLGKLPISP